MTQSSTRLTIGTFPTGMSALEATFVPSLNGYKLTMSSFREEANGSSIVPFTIADEDDSDKVLRVHDTALRHARRVEEAFCRHCAR